MVFCHELFRVFIVVTFPFIYWKTRKYLSKEVFICVSVPELFVIKKWIICWMQIHSQIWYFILMEFRTVEIICIYKIVIENGNLYVQTVPKYDRNYDMIMTKALIREFVTQNICYVRITNYFYSINWITIFLPNCNFLYLFGLNLWHVK